MNDIKYLSLYWGIETKNSKLEISTNNIRSNNNEIYFNAEITGETINLLIKEIDIVLSRLTEKQSSLLRDDTNQNKVILYIDSGGGSIKDCFKFIDYINILKKNNKLYLTTVCTGLVASAATLISLTGDIRYITPLSTYMIHELFSVTGGNYTHLTSRINHINNLHENIINLYLQFVPTLTKEKIIKLLQTETWLSAEECEELGFAKVL
jgi:ATP-dependent Clp protease protease subunit